MKAMGVESLASLSEVCQTQDHTGSEVTGQSRTESSKLQVPIGCFIMCFLQACDLLAKGAPGQ